MIAVLLGVGLVGLALCPLFLTIASPFRPPRGLDDFHRRQIEIERRALSETRTHTSWRNSQKRW